MAASRGHRLAPQIAVASIGYVVFGFAAVPSTLTARLDVGLGSFGLVVSVALGAFVLAQPLASWLTERYATTRLLVWGVCCHALLALVLDAAGSFRALLVLRFLWGFAGGFLLSVGATHVARIHEGAAATRWQGVYGGVLTLGGAVAFLVAPTLAQLSPLVAGGVGGLVHVPGAVGALPAALLSLRGDAVGTPPSSRRSVPVGGALSTVLRQPTVLVASLAYVALIGSYLTLSTFITAYYDDLGILAPLNAGVLLTATVGRAVGGAVVGSVSDAVVLGAGTAAAFCGFGLLATELPPTLVVVLPAVAMLAVSVPFGTTFAVAARATRYEGTALAVVIAAGNVAALVLPAVTGSLYDLTGAYAPGFALLALVNLAAFAGAVVLHTRYT